MPATLVVVLLLTIVGLSFVLSREVRLRRALERLLRRVLARFYSHQESVRESKPPNSAAAANDNVARRL